MTDRPQINIIFYRDIASAGIKYTHSTRIVYNYRSHRYFRLPKLIFELIFFLFQFDSDMVIRTIDIITSLEGC